MKTLFTKSDIEILISTMQRENLDFLNLLFPNQNLSELNLLIVNQTDKSPLTSGFKNIRVINSSNSGLSKSRNEALQNSIGKILVIADDDIVYKEGFLDSIINAYNQNPEAAIIKFRCSRDNSSYEKSLSSTNYIMNWFDILNAVSIEITINKKIVPESFLKFDEDFGLGSAFPAGEEQRFLADLKNVGLKLFRNNTIIVEHTHQSTGQKMSLQERYRVYGALMSSIFPKKWRKWLSLKFFFELKQKKIKLNEIKKAGKSFVVGRREFLNKNK